MKASQPGYGVAGGKSDRFDSFVLAELAPTPTLMVSSRVLVPDGDETKALGAMTGSVRVSCARGWGWRTSCAISSRCFWPGASKVFSTVDSQFALAFLQARSTPVDARGLGDRRAGGVSGGGHGYPGRKPAGELLERLRGAAEVAPSSAR